MEALLRDTLIRMFCPRTTTFLMVFMLSKWPAAASSDALQPTVHAPKPHSDGFQLNLALGDDAIASCFVPKAHWHGERLRIIWTKQSGEDLSANRRVSFLRPSESSITLGIRDIRREDIGNYTCVASADAASASVTVPLTVSGLPKLREFAFPPEVTLGEEILVSCVVKKGSPGPHHVTWLKDGIELEKTDRVSVFAQFKSSAALRIASLRAEDVGNYTCVASNPVGTSSFTASLVVHAPESFTFAVPVLSSTKYFVLASVAWWEREALARSNCPGGKTAILLNTRRDSQRLRTKVAPLSTLSIVDIRAEDSGNYTCVARNAAGSDEYSAHLAVTGNGYSDVRWSAARANGHEA
ncbi:hypothetical protein V5799_008411 [Amblyomma americanum]|uniref:Ig-like domain-containing protein n=1 Tax=Amblyomma americanum TaxID=6943 RepID=A0AAQ4FF00_AMBAM